MKTRTIYLLYNKAKPIDRKAFMAKFTCNDNSKYAYAQTYKMLVGTPILVNVEGTLIEASTLLDIIKNKRDYNIVNGYIASLKSSEYRLPRQIKFKWSR